LVDLPSHTAAAWQQLRPHSSRTIPSAFRPTRSGYSWIEADKWRRSSMRLPVRCLQGQTLVVFSATLGFYWYRSIALWRDQLFWNGRWAFRRPNPRMPLCYLGSE
jgi:hypothetical protein